MRDDYVVEGRWPKYENEVAVGTLLANNMELKVGDTITVKNGEENASYIITGLVQTFNNMGQMGYMTEEGFGRVGGSMPTGSIQIYLKKGYTYNDLDKEFKDVYPESELTDDVEATGGLFTMLKVSMQAILAIIMFVTVFIVALAEALIIRTKITKDWRNLGVFKALGFSSKELILQVMFSNIPAIIFGIVIGLVSVTFLGSKVMLLMFAIFGFRKVPFSLSAVAYISVVLVITGVALLVSYINGTRIKKLEPVKMITEE
jgi:ABC-type antimicrobial peptide transport system permease subunit